MTATYEVAVIFLGTYSLVFHNETNFNRGNMYWTWII